MSRDFSRRVLAPELMDDAACEPEEFAACLRDLAGVNRLTLAYRPTLRWLGRLARRHPGRRFRLLDVGGGYGDALRRIAAWAYRRGIALEMTSLDRSPWARRAGEAVTPPGLIRFVTADLFAWTPEGGFDAIISSLFAHHLTDDEVVEFLRWMEAHAELGWFVNDLRRHKLPFHAFRLWTRLARRHRFVRHDGPVSIARAFTEPEWRALLARAGFAPGEVEVTRRFPYRLCVGRIRP